MSGRWRLPKTPGARWAALAVLVAAPLVALNLAVAYFGETFVFPLSPLFLESKAHALGAYARHRSVCWIKGDADIAEQVHAASARNHLPPGLLESVVEVESRSKAHRISFAGAMGPAQLTRQTAKDLGVTDPFDPAQALDGSARYLAQLLHRYHDVRLAVAAYNAGPGAVGTTVPRNGETEFYVQRVMAEYARRRPSPPPRRPRPGRHTQS